MNGYRLDDRMTLPAAEASAVPADKPEVRGQVLRNVAANIGGRAIALLLSAGATIVVARDLGTVGLGKYGAIYAYLTLFAWMATFGFEPILVREISRARDNAASLLRTAMGMSWLLAGGTITIAVLIAPFAGYSGMLRVLVLLAGLEYVLTPLRLPSVIFQVDMRQWYSATINVVRQALWCVIVLILWCFQAPLLYVIGGRVLCAAIECVLLWAYGRRFVTGAGRFLGEKSKEMFTHAFPIAFASLLAMIYLRIDQVMLHKMVSDSELGQYVAAVRVSELFEALPAALMLAVAPIYAVSAADPARFREQTKRTFRYLMILASGLCVLIASVANLAVVVLFGRQFAAAGPLLAVLIWSEIAVFFSVVVVSSLVAQNRQRLLPVPTLAGAFVNIALNLVWIPRYGATGSAYATLISYSVAWIAVLCFFGSTRSLALQGVSFALPISTIALLACGGARLFVANAAFRVVAALILFGIGLLLARLIRKDDASYLLLAFKGSLARSSNAVR
jgi:O-antigen/teichoic acid export membrane protein